MTQFLQENQEIILDCFAINRDSIVVEVNHVKTPSIMQSIEGKGFDVAKSGLCNSDGCTYIVVIDYLMRFNNIVDLIYNIEKNLPASICLIVPMYNKKSFFNFIREVIFLIKFHRKIQPLTKSFIAFNSGNSIIINDIIKYPKYCISFNSCLRVYVSYAVYLYRNVRSIFGDFCLLNQIIYDRAYKK